MRIPPNAATRARHRTTEAFAAEDWQALRALTCADFTFDDRRKRSLVSGDVEMWIKNLEFVRSSPRARLTRELIGTVGDRIATERLVWTGDPEGGPFESEFIRLTEVGADGRLTASITFDPEDRRAASAEAQARFLDGEAAGCRAQAVIHAFGDGIARHDWNSLPKYFVDGLMYHDRRRLSFGEIPCDKFIESLHVLSELGPDVGGELLQILAWNDSGRVAVIRQSGTLREGGVFESVFVPVLVVRDDHIVAYEVFDVSDTDQALARFAELCASLP